MRTREVLLTQLDALISQRSEELAAIAALREQVCSDQTTDLVGLVVAQTLTIAGLRRTSVLGNHDDVKLFAKHVSAMTLDDAPVIEPPASRIVLPKSWAA